MGYTSKYAQDAMNKAVNGDKPKIDKVRTAKSAKVKKRKEIVMASKDPAYKAHLVKKKKEEAKSMSPNDPRY